MSAQALPIHLRILLALAGLQAASFIAVVLLTTVSIPILDIVGITHGFVADGFSWPWLLQPWNQHLIIVPRVLLMADITMTGGHMGIFTLLALSAWAGVVLICMRFANDAGLERRLLLLVAAVLGLAMFRGFLLESIIINNGFNYPFAALFAALAFALAAGVQPGKPVFARASFSALAALAGGFCLANGMLAVPVAAMVALLRGRAFLAVLPFFVAGGVLITIYAVAAPAGDIPVQLDTVTVLQSFTSVFGAPWVLKIGLLGQGVGLCVIFALLAAGVSLLRRLDRLDAVEVFAGAMMLFSLGSIGMIVIGRPELSAEIGAVGRYAIWVAMAHAGIALVALRRPLVVRWTERRSFRLVIMAGAALLMIEQARLVWAYSEMGQGMQQAAQALQRGERGAGLFDVIRTDPASAGPVFDLYAAHGLYGFRGPDR
jgi:hypothetical protein